MTTITSPVLTTEALDDILNAAGPAKRARQPIPNVSKLDAVQLRAALIKHGVDMAAHEAEAEGPLTKLDLIQIAKDADLWDYKGDVVPKKYKDQYGKTQRCGDEVSETLNAETRNENGGVDLKLLARIQRANGIDPKRYVHLNDGQQVMNTSNVIRGKVRRGEYAVIGGTEWNKEAQADKSKVSKK